MKTLTNVLSMLSILSLLQHCGPKSPSGSDVGSEEDATQRTAQAHLATMSDEQFEGYMFSKLDNLNSKVASKISHDVYINFNGGTLKKGYIGSQQSPLVCGDQAVIQPVEVSPSEQEDIVSRVEGIFSAAQIPVKVLKEAPKNTQFHTVNFVSSTKDLGCAQDDFKVLLGVRDDQNLVPNDQSFVIYKSQLSNQILAVRVAHAIGGMFGLAQTQDPADVMHPAVAKEDAKFKKSIMIGSTKEQDASAYMKKILKGQSNLANGAVPGQDTVTNIAKFLTETPNKSPFDISALRADIEALKLEFGKLEQLDRVIQVIMIAQLAAKRNPQLQKMEDITKKMIEILTDPKYKMLKDIATLAGFGSIVGALDQFVSVGNLILSWIGKVSPVPDKALALPRFDQLLSLDAVHSRVALATYVDGYRGFISALPEGDGKRGAITLAKIGFIQSLQGITSSTEE